MMENRDITNDAFDSGDYPIVHAAPQTKRAAKLNAEGGEVYLNIAHEDSPLCGQWRAMDGQDIHKSVDSSIPASGELLTIPDVEIGSDSFSPAPTKVKKESDVQRVIRKLTDMYIPDPLDKYADIWGFAECWGQDMNGKPVIVGIKVMTRSYYAKYQLPEVFEGYRLFFNQAGMEVPSDINKNGFKGVKRGTNLRLW